MAKKVVNNDISNRTVVIMLVVVILVSIVALGVYMNALDKAEPEIISGYEGKVQLTIEKPAEEPLPVEPDMEDAKVSLGITEALEE
jgi:hypothetical protein